MKKSKKLFALLLSCIMVIAMMPAAVFAEDTPAAGEGPEGVGKVADTWDGTADISWYIGNESNTKYHITTAEQLAGLAKLVNTDPGTTNFAGKTFYLESDIDLSGHEWISIGTVLGGDYPEYSFCGVFDGQGHVISNLYSHESYIEGADESHNLLRNCLLYTSPSPRD